MTGTALVAMGLFGLLTAAAIKIRSCKRPSFRVDMFFHENKASGSGGIVERKLDQIQIEYLGEQEDDRLVCAKRSVTWYKRRQPPI